MMHYGDIQEDSFRMMNLEEYTKIYGHRSLDYFLKDKNEAADNKSVVGITNFIKRQTALFMQNWKDNHDYHFYVPIQN